MDRFVYVSEDDTCNLAFVLGKECAKSFTCKKRVF